MPFCRRDELPLTSFSRLVQITTSHSIQSGSLLTPDSREGRWQLLRYRHYSPMQRENKQKNADKISDILHITCTTIYSSSIKQPMAPVIFATIHQRQIIGFHGESASRAERKIDQAILVGRETDLFIRTTSSFSSRYLFPDCGWLDSEGA